MVSGPLLQRLVDSNDGSLDAQGHVPVGLVAAVEEAHALVPRDPPVVEEPLHQVGVLEHDVVHVTVGLSVEGDGRGLTLGADPFGPRWVLLTPTLDPAADVVQGYKLPLQQCVYVVNMYGSKTWLSKASYVSRMVGADDMRCLRFMYSVTIYDRIRKERIHQLGKDSFIFIILSIPENLLFS